MADETIGLVADLVAAGEHDGHLLGFDEGVVGVVGRDQPLPLLLPEEIVAARIVGRRIRAAEQPADQCRRHVEVRRAAVNPAHWPPGPPDHQRGLRL